MNRKRKGFGLRGFDLYVARTNSIIEVRTLNIARKKRTDGTVVLAIPPVSVRRGRTDSGAS